MVNTFIFLRHGKTLVDENTPIADWVLTDDGLKKAQEVSTEPVFDSVDLIFSSEEIKAVQTAIPISTRINKPISKVKELGELNRPNGHSCGLDRYNEIKKKIYSDFDLSLDGWETINHALTRFSDAVDTINSIYENKTILIVAHGTVMSLYFAKLQGELDNMYSRWKGLGFCDFGIVSNGVVVKDIV